MRRSGGDALDEIPFDAQFRRSRLTESVDLSVRMAATVGETRGGNQGAV